MYTNITMETDEALAQFCEDYGIGADQIGGYQKEENGRLYFSVPFSESHFIPSIGKAIKSEEVLQAVTERLTEKGYQIPAEELTWSVAKSFGREIVCSFHYLMLFSPDPRGAKEVERRLNNPPEGVEEVKTDLVAIPANLLLYLYVKIDVSDLILDYQRKKTAELGERYHIAKIWESER